MFDLCGYSGVATIGERIRAARERAGLSVSKLAHAIGMDAGNLSKIENGRRNGSRMPHAVVEALCEELKTTPEALGIVSDVATSPPASVRRVVDGEDRYPSRPAALVALRAAGVDPATIDVIASVNAHSEGDPGTMYWVTDAVRDAKTWIAAAKRQNTAEEDAVFTTPTAKKKRLRRAQPDTPRLVRDPCLAD